MGHRELDGLQHEVEESVASEWADVPSLKSTADSHVASQVTLSVTISL